MHDHEDEHRDRFEEDGGHHGRFTAMARLIARSLPEDEAALPAALALIADDFRVRLALYRADRMLIASAGTPVPPPPEPGRTTGGHQRAAGGPVLLFRLPDGRWLSAHVPRRSRGRWLGLLATFAVVVAVGAWPLARRITRRLERLQTRVDALGAGDLGARVEVEGSDEIAALAESFNRAAERIESLVAVQRTMLASASHELRSPLARMRMAIELFADAPRPELRERIERDVAELDTLIDELLLASRLQTVQDLEAPEPVESPGPRRGGRHAGRCHGHRRSGGGSDRGGGREIDGRAGRGSGQEPHRRPRRPPPAPPPSCATFSRTPAGTGSARRSPRRQAGTKPACCCGSATGGRGSPRASGSASSIPSTAPPRCASKARGSGSACIW